MPRFLILNLLSAIFMFCNSAFEQVNLDLWQYINAFIIINKYATFLNTSLYFMVTKTIITSVFIWIL